MTAKGDRQPKKRERVARGKDDAAGRQDRKSQSASGQISGIQTPWATGLQIGQGILEQAGGVSSPQLGSKILQAGISAQ